MMNGNVTKEGITRDFEALSEAGFGGVQMFDAGCNIPPGGLDFNSPEWFELFRHAASEARRLDLEICIPNCSGWSSSGGPWDPPSNAMKRVVFTETRVSGPSRFRAALPREKEDNGFYEDIAVLAFPVPAAERVEFPDVKTVLEWETFDPWVDCRIGSLILSDISLSGKTPSELVRITKFNNVNGDGCSSGRGVVDRLEIGAITTNQMRIVGGRHEVRPH